MAETTRRWPSGACRGVERLTPTHQAMLEALLANPGLTHEQLAQQFGFASRNWIGQIIASEVFQQALARRRAELMAPVEDRFRALLSRAMDVMQAKLDRPAAEVADPVAVRALEISSRALGYRGGPPPAPKVEVNVVQDLEALGRNLEKLLIRTKARVNGATVDGEILEPPAALPKPGRG